ncbi:MAG: hypothetical protein V4665_01080 [Patescibacteria group bacterium]
MEQYTSLRFSELSDAILAGYKHDFVIQVSGTLKCLSKPGKVYSPDEVDIRVITSLKKKASLLLITTNDGLYKGTSVDYWEY